MEEFPRADEGMFRVAENLNFTVKENEFLVLFGPGQCGKTSILNMIAGFDLPTSGSILVDGKEVKGAGSGTGNGVSDHMSVPMADRDGKCGVWAESPWRE